MSLIGKLFNSRKYQSDTNSYTHESPMVDLVNELEGAASKKGINISRWQANKGGHRTTVTWAAHHGDRTDRSDGIDNGMVVSFDALEGKTSRSKSYKTIKSLLDYVKSLP